MTSLSKRVCQAAAAGDLDTVKQLFFPAETPDEPVPSPFVLSNEADPATGLTPLHFAASRDHYEVVQWLVEKGGAIVDLEDRDGEVGIDLCRETHILTVDRSPESFISWPLACDQIPRRTRSQCCSIRQ